MGSDIFFRQEDYNQETSSGRQLLAHELAHVVQQKPDTSLVSWSSGTIRKQGDPAVIARQAEEETMSPVNDASSLPEEPAFIEPYEGYGMLRARGKELDRLIEDTQYAYADAIVKKDIPWESYIELKLDIAKYKREKYLLDYFTVNYTWLEHGERAADILKRVQAAAESEESTLTLLQDGKPAGFSEILSYVLLNLPDLFPDYSINLYQAAVENFRDSANTYRKSFDKALQGLLGRPFTDIVPDFVWMMSNKESLQYEAGHIHFFNWLEQEAPVFLERRVPGSTSLGMNDITLKLNEHSRNWYEYLYPGLRENLRFLYPMLENWYFYTLYDYLAQKMDLFLIAVKAGYERINAEGSMPDVAADLLRAYSSRSPQVTHEEMENGFSVIYSRTESLLNRWVGSLSGDERIWEGFGLYDLYGETGSALKAMVNPLAIAMMVGFISFLIAVQSVPFANLVVDAILIALGAVDILKGIGIFGYYFDQASNARTFSRLYYAAQGLKGGGETILNLLFTLAGLGASGALKAYTRYRSVKKFRNLDDIANDDIIRCGNRDVRRAFDDARKHQKTFSKWEEGLNSETIAALEENPGLRKFYADMDPAVRRILTKCSSPCLPLKPPPNVRDIERIKSLLDKLKLPEDHGGLREYFYINRRNLPKAVDDITSSVKDVKDLAKFLDSFIARRAAQLGGKAVRRADDLWEFTRADGVVIREYELGTHYNLTTYRNTGGFFQSHHGVQGEWGNARLQGYYEYNKAPTILLRNSRSGTPHQIVTSRQSSRLSGIAERTYAQERKLLREDMAAAGVPKSIANELLANSDAFFAEIYRELKTVMSRKELEIIFGHWIPG